MNNTISLPRSRVAALAAETRTSSEIAIAGLLSVLHSRKMWAHLDTKRSTQNVCVFVYGANVPTPIQTRRARRTRDSKRNKSGAYLCVHVGRKNGLDVFEDIPPVKRTRNSKRNRKAVAV